MRTLAAFCLAACVAWAVPSNATGQEVQVPLDEAGQVDEVDRDLARRLGLFLDTYPELRIVRLYDVRGDGFILEITFRTDGQTSRQRVAMTADEVRELRGRVSRALAENAPDVTLNQEGRFLLLGATTALGVTFYGSVLPVVLDLQSGRLALATYMFTAGASFAGPYLYTRDRPVTYGMANAGFWGATRGISHGFYVAGALDANPGDRATFGAAMATSLAEGLGGYVWARNTDMSAASAHTIGNFGDFGTLWTGELLMVTRSTDSQVNSAALLAGAAAGLVAGTRLDPGLDYTWGDAEVQRTGHALGLVHGAVIYDWMYGDGVEDRTRILGALMMAGSAAGTWAAHGLLHDRDFSVSEGVLVELGTVAGGLVGMGLAVLLGPEQMTDPTLLFTLGAIGADVGLLATYNGLADNARARAERGDDRGLEPERGRLELHVDPTALLRFGLGHAAAAPAAPDVALPFFSLRYRF